MKLRRSARIALYLGIAVVGLEAILQLGTFVVWRITRPPRRAGPSAGESVVLCVGDSYTYGLGTSSTEGSYPAQLQRLVAGRDARWRVVNGGLPGRNSRDVALVLDDQLPEWRPSVVYVLVGVNDLWGHPTRLRPGERGTGQSVAYPWRFRTGRLFALAVHGLRRSFARAAQSHSAAAPPGAGPPPPQANGRVGRSDAAWGMQHPRELFATDTHFQRGLALTRERRQEEALAELAWLRNENQRLGEPEHTAKAVVRLAEELGEGQEALELARRVVQKYPDNPWVWRTIAWQSYQRGDVPAAADAIDHAIALSDDLAPRDGAFFLDTRARILRAGNPQESLCTAVKAFLTSPDENNFIQAVKNGPTALPETMLSRCLEDPSVPPGERERIRGLFRIGAAPTALSTEALQILQENLEAIVLRIHSGGARAVLVSYPFPSETNAIMERVAHQTGSGWIDLSAEFQRRLRGVAHEVLFNTDGHCTDKGYAIVAEVIARDLH